LLSEIPRAGARNKLLFRGFTQPERNFEISLRAMSKIMARVEKIFVESGSKDLNSAGRVT